jgi:hypothetical protein
MLCELADESPKAEWKGHPHLSIRLGAQSVNSPTLDQQVRAQDCDALIRDQAS